MEIISFDEKNKVFRDQMGVPFKASEALWFLLRSLEHLSNTEAEIYKMRSEFFNNTNINFNITNIHNECIDENYDRVLKFLDMHPSLRVLIEDFRKARHGG